MLAKLVRVRRMHYHATLREQIKRAGHLLLIVFAFTSLLIPLALSALIHNAVLLDSHISDAILSLIALQIIGTAWVILQARAIAGAPYQSFFEALPIGKCRMLQINLGILAEADAPLAALWLVAIFLMLKGSNSPLESASYVLRALAVAVLILTIQYMWLWHKQRALAFTGLILFNAGLVATMDFSQGAHSNGLLMSALILVGSVCVGLFLLVGVKQFQFKIHVPPHANQRAMKAHRDLNNCAATLNDNPYLGHALVRFYVSLLFRGVRENLVLRTAAALGILALALSVSQMHSSGRVALLFWFAGVAMAANIIASLRQSLKDAHANAQRYCGALPIRASQFVFADGMTLCLFATMAVIPFALAGTLLTSPRMHVFLWGIPLALATAAGHFAIGTHFPKQSVVLTFLLDVILVAAFTYGA